MAAVKFQIVFYVYGFAGVFDMSILFMTVSLSSSIFLARLASNSANLVEYWHISIFTKRQLSRSVFISFAN